MTKNYSKICFFVSAWIIIVLILAYFIPDKSNKNYLNNNSESVENKIKLENTLTSTISPTLNPFQLKKNQLTSDAQNLKFRAVTLEPSKYKYDTYKKLVEFDAEFVDFYKDKITNDAYEGFVTETNNKDYYNNTNSINVIFDKEIDLSKIFKGDHLSLIGAVIGVVSSNNSNGTLTNYSQVAVLYMTDYTTNYTY